LRKQLATRSDRWFENFRRVPVREKAVGLEILIHFDEVQIAARVFASAAGAGLAIANDTAPGASRPACVRGRKARITLVA